jgi:hypothetical protein
MTDLASLSFSIDSSQAKQASDTLTAMALAAAQANTSQKDLAQTSAAFSQSLQQQLQAMTMWQFGLQQAGSALQLMITQMHAWQDVMGTSTTATNSFRDSLNQVIAVATTFGQSAAGFETFVNQANRLKLAADQIPQALQRISAATENQTPFGMQVRQVAQSYGTIVPQGGYDQAGDVLQSFVANAGQYRDTMQKLRDIQTVLGPMDAQSIRQLQRLDYVPIATQQARNYAQSYNVQADRTAQFVDQQTYQNNQFAAQYADLTSRYNVPPSMSFSTQAQQLDYLQNLQQNGSIWQKLGSSTNLLGALFDPAVVGTSNPLLNTLSYWNSGQFGRNQSAIMAQFVGDRQQQGLFPAAWTAIGREVSNYLPGGYTAPAVNDNRFLSPADIAAQQTALGGQLAGFGSSGYAQWANATQQIAALNAPGNGLGLFQRAYGDTEGARQFYNASTALGQQQTYALAPWQRQQDQTGQQAWLMSLPPDQRARAQAFLQAAPQYGVSTSNLRPGTTLAQAMGGPGLNDNIAGAINGSFDQGVAGQLQGSQEASQRDIDLQTQLQQKLTEGKAAADDFVKSWQARTQALLDGATKDQAAAAASDALNKSTAERITIGKALLVQIGQQTDATKQQINIAANATSSNDPIQRAAAAYAFGVDNTTLNAILSGQIDGSQGTAYTAAQFNQLSNQGLLSAYQRTNTQRNTLGQQQQVLSVAQAGGNTGYAQQSIQLQQQYSDDLAKAQAQVLSISQQIWSGNAQDLANAKAKVSAIQSQADAAQQLLQAQQRATEATKNYSDANSMENQAQLNMLIAGAPDSQRGLMQTYAGVIGSRMNDISMRQQTPSTYNVPQQYQAAIAAAAQQYGVPQNFLTTMLGTENSGFNPNLVNPKSGAIGLGQFMPSTAQNVPGYGPVDPTNPIASINAMAAYLANLQKNTGQSGAQSWLTAGMQYKGAGSFMSQGVSSQAIADLATSLGVNLGTVMSPSQMIASIRPGGNGAPDLQALGAAATDLYGSQQAVAMANTNSATNLATARFRAGLPFAQAGMPQAAQFAALGVANPQLAPGNAAAGTTSAQLGYVQGLTNSTDQSNGALLIQIQQAQMLAQAALAGNAALQQLQQTLQNYNSLQQAGAMKSMSTTSDMTQAINTYIASLQKSQALQQQATNAQGMIKVNSAIAGNNSESDLLNANLALGPFINQDQAQMAMVAPTVHQQMLNDPTQAGLVGTSAESDLVQSTQAVTALKQLANQQQAVRSGFDAMSSSILNSFTSAVTGGQNLRSVLSGLLNDLIKITIQATVQKPLSNALSSGASGLWGLLTSGISGYSAEGLPTASTLTSLGNQAAANIAGGSAGLAAGGVYNPIRLYGSGGLFGGPTLIPAADGMVLAGEAGPEAAMPLTRLANGDLGVKMSGGSSGGFSYSPAITVHVNSPANGNGAANVQASKQMGDIISRQVKQTMDDNMARHLQPGGLIYSAIRQNRGVA